MGNESSTGQWSFPLRDSLTGEEAEEFKRNIEAAEELIYDPDYLMLHIERLFPNLYSIPQAMMQSITQSFIDRLRIQDQVVLVKVAAFFQDVSDHNEHGVSKKILRGYLVAVLSILMQGAIDEASRLGVNISLKRTLQPDGTLMLVEGESGEENQGVLVSHVLDSDFISTIHEGEEEVEADDEPFAREEAMAVEARKKLRAAQIFKLIEDEVDDSLSTRENSDNSEIVHYSSEEWT